VIVRKADGRKAADEKQADEKLLTGLLNIAIERSTFQESAYGKENYNIVP
jgi:hypothetical protein